MSKERRIFPPQEKEGIGKGSSPESAGGLTRRGFLKGATVAVVAAVAGGVLGRKFGEEEVEVLGKEIEACRQKVGQGKEELQDCRKELAGNTGRLGDLQAELAGAKSREETTKGLLEEEIAELQKQIGQLQEENNKWREENKKLIDKTKKLEAEKAEAIAKTSQALAIARIQESLAGGNPLVALGEVREFLGSLPLRLSDEAIEGLGKTKETIIEIFGLSRKLVVPIYEIANGLKISYGPLIGIVDKFLEGLINLEKNLRQRLMESYENACGWVVEKIPDSKTKDFFQGLRESFRKAAEAIEVWREIKGKEGYKPFSQLLETMLGKLKEIDDKLSEGPNRIIREIEENIVNIIKGRETNIRKRLEEKQQEIEEQARAAAQGRLEAERLRGVIADDETFQEILKILRQQSLPITPDNIIKVAKSLLEKK